MRDEQGPVEIGPVDQRRDVRGGCRGDRALHHAAEHQFHPHRPRGVNHCERPANAAGLRELDVDPVNAPVERGQVCGDVGVLVGDDRDLHALANRAQLVWAAGRDRLLAKLNVEALELAQDRHGRLDVPPFVGIDAQRAGIAPADRRDGLDLLGSGTAPEFDLQRRKAGRFGEFGQRRFGIGNADRKRRHRRRRRIESEQRVERFAEPFADEIVQREIEPGACRRRYAGVQQRLQSIRIVRC